MRGMSVRSPLFGHGPSADVARKLKFPNAAIDDRGCRAAC